MSNSRAFAVAAEATMKALRQQVAEDIAVGEPSPFQSYLQGKLDVLEIMAPRCDAEVVQLELRAYANESRFLRFDYFYRHRRDRGLR